MAVHHESRPWYNLIMGTHCYVGVEDQQEGSITYAYVHYDGYPDGVGKTALEMEPEDVINAIEGGEMRSLCCYPDYLSQNSGSHEADDLASYEDAIEEGPVEYGYLLNGDGEWQVYFVHGDRAGAWVDLRAELGMAPKAPEPVQPASEPGYTGSTGGKDPMQTNEIIGFHIRNNESGECIATDPATGRNFCTFDEVTPIARGDAFRRLAGFLDQNPDADPYDFGIETVYRQTTPIENAASELGGLFEQLCKRHGLDLGLDRTQINALLAKDLEQVKNLGFITGIPGRK